VVSARDEFVLLFDIFGLVAVYARCSDLSMEPRRHVGGTLNMNKESLKIIDVMNFQIKIKGKTTHIIFAH